MGTPQTPCDPPPRCTIGTMKGGSAPHLTPRLTMWASCGNNITQPNTINGTYTPTRHSAPLWTIPPHSNLGGLYSLRALGPLQYLGEGINPSPSLWSPMFRSYCMGLPATPGPIVIASFSVSAT